MKPIEPPERPAARSRAAQHVNRLASRSGLLATLQSGLPLLPLVLLPGLAYMLLVRLPAILAAHSPTWHRLPPSLLQQQLSLDLSHSLAADMLSLSSAFFTSLLASSLPLSY